MLEILLRGVSTRQYAKVLPEMARWICQSAATAHPATITANSRWKPSDLGLVHW